MNTCKKGYQRNILPFCEVGRDGNSPGYVVGDDVSTGTSVLDPPMKYPVDKAPL